MISAPAAPSLSMAEPTMGLSGTVSALVQETDMLFVGEISNRELKNLIERIKGNPVLTIGDQEGLAEKGIMISFFAEDEFVRFKVNPSAARTARLKFADELLKLGVVVGG